VCQARCQPLGGTAFRLNVDIREMSYSQDAFASGRLLGCGPTCYGQRAEGEEASTVHGSRFEHGGILYKAILVEWCSISPSVCRV
jgi:hypothetical protein